MTREKALQDHYEAERQFEKKLKTTDLTSKIAERNMQRSNAKQEDTMYVNLWDKQARVEGKKAKDKATKRRSLIRNMHQLNTHN